MHIFGMRIYQDHAKRLSHSGPAPPSPVLDQRLPPPMPPETRTVPPLVGMYQHSTPSPSGWRVG